MKENTIREKLEEVNKILREVKDEVKSLDFSSARKDLNNLSKICDAIFSECEKIEIISDNENYPIVPIQRCVSSIYFDYSENLKEELQKAIDNFSPISLSIDEIKVIHCITYVYFSIK